MPKAAICFQPLFVARFATFGFELEVVFSFASVGAYSLVRVDFLSFLVQRLVSRLTPATPFPLQAPHEQGLGVVCAHYTHNLP